jgi:hypothetical protein
VVILSDVEQDSLDTAEDAEEAEEEEAEEEEAEEEEAEEEEAREEAEEAEEETLKFMSIWRASCGKEQLPGTWSRVLDPSLISLMAVHKWQNTLLADLLPKTFKVVGLQAIASYERCRTVDEIPQELKTLTDLLSVVAVLIEWHRRTPNRLYQLRIQLSLDEIKPLEPPPSTHQSQQCQQGQQSRRMTSTRRQEAGLSNVLESEERPGNYMGLISDRWPCENSQCRNKGKTCWRSGKLNGPDIAANHFPVVGYLFQRWSREIRDELATVDEPSNAVVVALAREKSHETRKEQAETAKTEDPARVTASLLNVLLAAQIRHYEQDPCRKH